MEGGNLTLQGRQKVSYYQILGGNIYILFLAEPPLGLDNVCYILKEEALKQMWNGLCPQLGKLAMHLDFVQSKQQQET